MLSIPQSQKPAANSEGTGNGPPITVRLVPSKAGRMDIIRCPFFPPHGDSMLRLDPHSVKVLAISGVKYESKPPTLNRDYNVSGGTVRLHFDVPTPKVTVSRRKQDQNQEAAQ